MKVRSRHAAVISVAGIGLTLSRSYFVPKSELFFDIYGVDEGSLPTDAPITGYEVLSPIMQDAFDEARRDGPVYVGDSNPDWYEFPGCVEYEGRYYDTGGVCRDPAPAPGNMRIGLALVISGGLFLFARAISHYGIGIDRS